MMSERFLLNTKVPRLVFLTGAGLSAESGIPTFRDSDGLWENFNVEDVCNIKTFDQNYDLVHKFYNERRMALSTVEPNAAHHFIAEMQQKYGTDRVIHITANVDDLVERCGGQSIHVHGNILEVLEPFDTLSTVKNIGYAEHVPTPGVRSKPNVVFFGECYRYDEYHNKVPIYEEMDYVLDALKVEDTAIVIGSSDQVITWSRYVGTGSYCYSVNVNPKVNEEVDFRYSKAINKSATEAIDEMKIIIDKRM